MHIIYKVFSHSLSHNSQIDQRNRLHTFLFLFPVTQEPSGKENLLTKMKKLFFAVALICATLCSSCSGNYDDSALWDGLNSLEARVARLEELCKQMNTNISSLQTIVTALQDNDYVTGVAPISKEGEIIGYTITFSKSSPITIYHGKDGKDGVNGTNGADGYTPVIGVKKHTDGIYYWTLDGDWLLDDAGNKIKAQGTDGQDGINGTNGIDGTDGQKGKDGITPQLKIENDYWYISYDNGVTWHDLGQVAGESVMPTFRDVSYDEDFVYITFADGTELVLEIYKTDIIDFKDPAVWAICVSNWDTDGDGELSYKEAATVTDLGSVFQKGWEDGADIVAFPELKYFTGLKSIASEAFSYCRSLVHVQLPNSITSIGDEAFFYCDALENITIPESVVSIGTSAFWGCETFDSVTIPNSVTSIGDRAFGACIALESVTIGDGVTQIGDLAFSGGENLSAFYGKFTSTDNRCLIIDGELIAFAPAGLTSYIIPECVTSIGESAFSDCNLKDVTIPNCVTIIEDWAFGRSSLESITIGNRVTLIGENAFFDCPYLSSVTIPDSVTSIGNYAFGGCGALESIYCKPIDPPSLGDSVFYYYYPGPTIHVPSASVDAYKAADGWKDYADIIVGYDFSE